jgi:hypothetical protein
MTYSDNFRSRVRTFAYRDEGDRAQSRSKAMAAGQADHVSTICARTTMPAIQRASYTTERTGWSRRRTSGLLFDRSCPISKPFEWILTDPRMRRAFTPHACLISIALSIQTIRDSICCRECLNRKQSVSQVGPQQFFKRYEKYVAEFGVSSRIINQTTRKRSNVTPTSTHTRQKTEGRWAEIGECEFFSSCCARRLGGDW